VAKCSTCWLNLVLVGLPKLARAFFVVGNEVWGCPHVATLGRCSDPTGHEHISSCPPGLAANRPAPVSPSPEATRTETRQRLGADMMGVTSCLWIYDVA
jgi:hypothetical protein